MDAPRRTILVADDEAPILDMMELALSAEGYRVLTARDGRQAVAVLDREKVDLALMDLRMPFMDGMDTARTLMTLHPGLPIVLMTGYLEPRVKNFVETEAGGFLQKPFTMAALRDTVRSVLSRSSRPAGAADIAAPKNL
jgi:DNA-binding response OmpR family regulator